MHDAAMERLAADQEYRARGGGPPPGYAEREINLDDGRTLSIVDDFAVQVAVPFELDSYRLTAAGRMAVEEIASVMSRPEAEAVKYRIHGHTCDLGDWRYNLELSERRAAEVKRALVRAGVRPDRLMAAGMGEADPLIPDATTEADRRANRRVTFELQAPSR